MFVQINLLKKPKHFSHKHTCLICGKVCDSTGFGQHLRVSYKISRRDYAEHFETEEWIKCANPKCNVYFFCRIQNQTELKCHSIGCAVGLRISSLTKEQKKARSEKSKKAMIENGTWELAHQKTGHGVSNFYSMHPELAALRAQKAAKKKRENGEYEFEECSRKSKKAHLTKLENNSYERANRQKHRTQTESGYFSSPKFLSTIDALQEGRDRDREENPEKYVEVHKRIEETKSRNGVSRNYDKKSKKGYYTSKKSGIRFMFDSGYEYFRMKQLDEDESIILWTKNSSPVTKWKDEKGEWHNYSPDFFIWKMDGNFIIEEVKGVVKTKSVELKKLSIEKFCLENNIGFRFMIHKDIFPSKENNKVYRQFIKNYSGITDYL